ncbi:hypothetical protein EYF80_032293 [Liparis tanakae]|uniref:Uncharacterized protein n=1 Tax=Liparis tanakae TaxID=230148 RepID=A0A4Z2GVJ5_9TELE|nr:hypothetical protein EYF80_032293 [Liparis tanakae]
MMTNPTPQTSGSEYRLNPSSSTQNISEVPQTRDEAKYFVSMYFYHKEQVQVHSDPPELLPDHEIGLRLRRGEGVVSTVKEFYFPQAGGDAALPPGGRRQHAHRPHGAGSHPDLPAVGPGAEALGAQHREVVVAMDPLGVVRERLQVSWSHDGQVLRQDESGPGRVRVQNHRTVGDQVLHLAPDVEGQVAQVFGLVYQSSREQLWVLQQGAPLDSCRCSLVGVEEQDVFGSQLVLCGSDCV